MTTYLTVAIPYVNARPHLGYAYELVLADAHARARRLAGEAVRFLGGTDDGSLKNVLAADAAGVPTRAFVDAHATRFQELAGALDLSFDDFIRTSADPRHAPAVERLWRACAASGDLYRQAYEGDYCVGCEQFYTADEIVDGRCPEHRTATERVAEENWFFRLSAYQDVVERLLVSGALLVRPEPFRDEMLAFVRRGLADISVSRSRTRARGWGIPVPGDPSQVVYVWFDALANYVSALGWGGGDGGDYRRWWVEAQRRTHVIGKGILRFHAVYWPAFLASAGLPLPTRVQVHPYLTVGGEKVSKSGPGTADPFAVVDAYGTDALRWWFASDVGPVADTDFTVERLVARANEDLANGLGNLTHRVVTLAHRHGRGRLADVEVELVEEVGGLQAGVVDAVIDFDLRRAARHIRAAVAGLNRDIEVTRPWSLARDDSRAGTELRRLLARHLHSARAIAAAAQPLVPRLSARLLEQLGDAAGVPEPRVIVPRIDPALRPR